MKRILALLWLLIVAPIATAANPVVVLRTSLGEVSIELYPEKAPKTVENFLQYARDGFYDNTLFHRVIDGFMIQGGGFDKDMSQKTTRPPVRNEGDNGLKNAIGSIAMARTQDPHSASAQFFINLADNDFLNHRGPTLQAWGYCVFGRVTKGMDVVQAIAKVKKGRVGPFDDVPLAPVVIESIRLAKP